MRTVIYKERTYAIVRIVEGEVSISDIKQDEDFMPVDLWNQSEDKKHFPTIK